MDNLQAQRYAALRKPYLINDMVMQDILLDRIQVYAVLEARHSLLLFHPSQSSVVKHMPNC